MTLFHPKWPTSYSLASFHTTLPVPPQTSLLSHFLVWSCYTPVPPHHSCGSGLTESIGCTASLLQIWSKFLEDRNSVSPAHHSMQPQEHVWQPVGPPWMPGEWWLYKKYDLVFQVALWVTLLSSKPSLQHTHQVEQVAPWQIWVKTQQSCKPHRSVVGSRKTIRS